MEHVASNRQCLLLAAETTSRFGGHLGAVFHNAIDDVNYGDRRGVGHELPGFDDSGARFDAAGNLQNWVVRQ